VIKQFLVRRFWSRAHAGGGIRTWAHEAVVRRAINRRISGAEDVWPVDWFARELVSSPFARSLSLGCGDGALERDLMSKGLCESILGVDISERALELARDKARLAGYSTVEYATADLDRLSLAPNSYDAVFAHQSLHHVRELETCLEQVAAALRPAGVLYLDEYVGPSRHQWSKQLLAAADEVYGTLPQAVRRRRHLQLPVDWQDPSEAVRSSEILPLVEAGFSVRERRDYGGNLLSVIHPHLRLDGLQPQEREELLADLLAREDELLAAGENTYYTVMVATT